MADVIRANYEVLDKVTNQFKQQADATGQMLQQVLRTLRPLQNGGWQGGGAEAFFNEMQSKVVPAVRRLSNALAEAGAVTQQISSTLHQAEQSASSPFQAGTDAKGGAAIGAVAAVAAAGALAMGRSLGELTNLGDSFSTEGTNGSDALDGALADHSFTTGDDSTGADGTSGDPTANDNDYGIPKDWLGGAQDSLHDYVQDNFDDAGIPKDWLSGVKAETDGSTTSADAANAASSGGGSGSGGGGESGGGSGGGGESGGGSSGGSSGGGGETGSGAGSGAGMSDPGLGSGGGGSMGSGGGGMGSGGGSSMPSSDYTPYSSDYTPSFSSPSSSAYDLPSDYTRGYDPTTTTSANQSSDQGKFIYHALSGGGGSNTAATVPAVRHMSGAGAGSALSNAAPTSQMGLSIGLAAVSPFLALLGKTLSKKTNER